MGRGPSSTAPVHMPKTLSSIRNTWTFVFKLANELKVCPDPSSRAQPAEEKKTRERYKNVGSIHPQGKCNMCRHDKLMKGTLPSAQRKDARVTLLKIRRTETRRRKKYQHSIEEQKCDQNLAPVLVINLWNSLVHSNSGQRSRRAKIFHEILILHSRNLSRKMSRDKFWAISS